MALYYPFSTPCFLIEGYRLLDNSVYTRLLSKVPKTLEDHGVV